MKEAYVYIMSSKRNGTLYVGVTSDLVKRVYEHKAGIIDGFTKRYRIGVLVYYEMHESIMNAIEREKQLKKWNRDWKIAIIEKFNPTWQDLYDSITQ